MGGRMNFIRDRELAIRFKNGAVPSRERLIYLLLFVVPTYAMTTTAAMSAMASVPGWPWDTHVDIAWLALAVIGTIICYRTNKAGDDKEFIERYMCLSFPVAVQMVLVTVAGVVAAWMIKAYVLRTGISETGTLIEDLSIGFAQIYYFWRLNSSIRLAAS